MNEGSTPDAELIATLRQGTRRAEALAALRRRHLPALLRYARLTDHDGEPEQLAEAAFQRGASEALSGAVRYRLLCLVEELAPRPASVDGLPLVRRAFTALPGVSQALLWHTSVEGDGPAVIGELLGLDAGEVPVRYAVALRRLRSAYLWAFEAWVPEETCRRFTGLLDAATRPYQPRTDEDFDRHLDGCRHCGLAHAELAGLNVRPGLVLAQGLLPWGGAYARESRTSGPPATGAPRERRDRSVLIFTLLVGLLLAGTLSALVPGGDHTVTAEAVPGGPVPVPAISFPLTRGEPSSAAPVASPSAATRAPAGAETPSASPSSAAPVPPSPSPSATAPTATPAPSPQPVPAGDMYFQLVNAASGLCLDVRDGALKAGQDIVVNSCTGARTQRWNLGRDGLLRNLADPTLCLNSSSGSAGYAAAAPCARADDPERASELLAVTAAGALRATASSDAALAPASDHPGSGVNAAASDGSAKQTWRTTAVLATR